VAVSLVLVAGVGLWIARQPAPRIPSGGTAVLDILLASCVYAGATFGRAERWRTLLGACGIRAARADAYKLTPVGYMGNNILPARAGELLRVMMLAPRAGASRTSVLGTIVGERALDALVLSLVFFAGAIAIGTTVGTLGVIAVGGAVVALGVVMLALMRAARFADRPPPVQRRFGRPLRWLGETAQPLRYIRGRVAVRVLALSFLLWSAEAVVYLLSGDAVGVRMSVSQATSVMVLANLASLIPAAPGYLGTFDAAVVGSIRAFGIAPASASAYLLLLRFVLFVPITIVGLAIFIGSYAGVERLRAARLRAEGA
jgi:uncharacterized protein (TIRG00374 family)